MIKAAITGCIFCEESEYSKKLKEKNLVIHKNSDNPLYEEPVSPLEEANRKHMFRDAEMRNDPANGKVYQGFKSLQYKYSED